MNNVTDQIVSNTAAVASKDAWQTPEITSFVPAVDAQALAGAGGDVGSSQS